MLNRLSPPGAAWILFHQKERNWQVPVEFCVQHSCSSGRAWLQAAGLTIQLLGGELSFLRWAQAHGHPGSQFQFPLGQGWAPPRGLTGIILTPMFSPVGRRSPGVLSAEPLIDGRPSGVSTVAGMCQLSMLGAGEPLTRFPLRGLGKQPGTPG